MAGVDLKRFDVVAGPFDVGPWRRWIIRCKCRSLHFITESDNIAGNAALCAACRTVGRLMRRRTRALEEVIRGTARSAVNIAVRAGTLVRGRCVNGCVRPAQAHHEDYSRALSVEWLCARCHKLRHAELTLHGVDLMGAWRPVLDSLEAVA